MAEDIHLTCDCPHCGGRIEFPPEWAGAGVDCPHCGTPVNLVEPEPEAAGDPGRGEEGTVAGVGGGGDGRGRPLAAGELAAALSGRLPRRRHAASYWAATLAAAVVMVILPALYLAVLGLVGWGVMAAAASWWRGLGTAGSAVGAPVSLALHAAAVLLGLAVLVLLLKPIFAPRSPRSDRLALHLASEPLLFAFVHMIADTVGAPRPTRVQVDCRLNASAGLSAGWGGMFGGGLVLTLGLPLVSVLDLRGLAGVIAHELAHFDQGAGLRLSSLVRAVSAWLGRMAQGRDAWDDAVERYLHRSGAGVGRVLVGGVRFGVEASRWFFAGLDLAGRLMGGILLRQMERDADQRQIDLVGSEGFESIWRRRAGLAAVAPGFYRELRKRWDETGELPEDLPAALAAAEAGLEGERRERWEDRALARSADLWDAHPVDRERLERARAANVPGLFRLNAPASAVFAAYGTLARQVTVLHCEDRLGIPRQKVRWVAAPGAS